jgi:DNA repair protein RadD
MLLVPRDYQEFGIDQTFRYFEEKGGNPLLLYPTATGKSVVVAGICVRALRDWPQTRILMLTKTQELVEQNLEKLKLAWSDAPVGVYCDALSLKQHHYPITFGTIGSVYKVGEIFGFIDFIIVDECHEISLKDESMYRKLINKLKERNPLIKVIGLTATGYRMKQGKLINGENALFTDEIVDCTGMDAYNWFFDQGYLVPPVPRPTRTSYDLSKVNITGGEYEQASLQQVVDNDEKNESAVQEMLEWSHDRNCCVVFGSGVEHVKHLAEILEYYGQDVTWVASKGIAPGERTRRIEAFKRGEYKWIVNNGILTTGFDHPPIDFIGMVRHTLSTGLWVQMCGRGTRPCYAPGYDLSHQTGRLEAIYNSAKRNCMILDFAQNVTRLGPINDPRVPLPKERKRVGDAPIRICDQCGCYNHAAAVICWNCGYLFPRHLKIGQSGTEDLIRTNALRHAPLDVRDRAVDRVGYVRWKKRDRPDSIKVVYHCGHHMYSEWICLEHGGYPTHRAHEWWRKRCDLEPPATTDEGLRLVSLLKQPRIIKVVVNQPNGEIVDYAF